jgi:NAD(P)H-nitrite reductase large subunit
MSMSKVHFSIDAGGWAYHSRASARFRVDMLGAGVDASPVTELIATSGLTIANGIIVNEYLETDHKKRC